MAKKSLLNRITIFSLLMVALPFSFDENKQEKVVNPVVAEENEPSLYELNPITAEEFLNLQQETSAYYLMGFLNEDNLGLLSFDDSHSSMGIYTIEYGDNYSIDISDRILSAINGVVEVSVKLDYTNMEKKYLIASMEYCKYIYVGEKETMYLDFSEYGNNFRATSYPDASNNYSLAINSYYYDQTIYDNVDQYLYYDADYDSLKITTENKSEVLFYPLSNDFIEQYSWQYKFNSITEDSDPALLLTMWQGLSYYDKKYIIDSFYEDPEAGIYPPAYDSGGKEGVMTNLMQKFNMYQQLVSNAGLDPFRCVDMDPNAIKVDYSRGVITGFSGFDCFTFASSIQDMTFYVDFEEQTEMSLNNPDYPILGAEFDLYYSVNDYDFTYSLVPLHISFKTFNPDITPLDNLSLDSKPINEVDGKVVMEDTIYANSFTLTSIPEGYEAAVVTIECYENNISFINLDETDYSYFDTDKMEYQSEELTFSEAYDENWSLVPLQEVTTYRLVYRLKDSEEYAPSYLCGYFDFTTISESDAYSKETKINNYEAYNEIKSSPRFMEALEIDASTYGDFAYYFDNLFSSISSSSKEELESLLAERSLYDRYYYKASEIMLTNFMNSLKSDRAISYFNEQIEEFRSLYEEGTFEYEEMDNFVDSLIANASTQIDLYTLQEEAAKQIADYFNNKISTLIGIDLPESLWNTLSTYLKEIYDTSSKEEIDEYVSNFINEFDNLIN